MAKGPSARAVALEVLLQINRDGAYANLALPVALSSSTLDERDRALVTEMVYGSLRREGELDAVIAEGAGRQPSTLEADVLAIARLGVYQLLYMRIPSHAAVDESVRLAKASGLQRAAGFLNGLLRGITRKPPEYWTGIIEEDTGSFHSHPPWITREIERALETCEVADNLGAVLDAHNEPPRVTLVHLPGLSEPTENPTPYSPLGSVLSGGNPATVAGVAQGWIRVQDEGSQLAALMLSRVEKLHEGDSLLDMCAGPGGKTAVLAAEASKAHAVVTAWEKAPHRARLVEQSVAGVLAHNPSVVNVVVGDAKVLTDPRPGFTRVLVDAPCSGLGALRRRPEARWRKSFDDLAELVALQKDLLTRALDLCAPGGYVAYVTCSPVVAETTEVVDAVLVARHDAILVDTPSVLDRVARRPVMGARRGSAVQLWSSTHGTDAMFVQLIQRVSSVG